MATEPFLGLRLESLARLHNAQRCFSHALVSAESSHPTTQPRLQLSGVRLCVHESVDCLSDCMAEVMASCEYPRYRKKFSLSPDVKYVRFETQ